MSRGAVRLFTNEGGCEGTPRCVPSGAVARAQLRRVALRFAQFGTCLGTRLRIATASRGSPRRRANRQWYPTTRPGGVGKRFIEIAAIKGVDRAPGYLDVLPRHRLLPNPSGFEGGGAHQCTTTSPSAVPIPTADSDCGPAAMRTGRSDSPSHSRSCRSSAVNSIHAIPSGLLRCRAAAAPG
jgi:hypothetical protein